MDIAQYLCGTCKHPFYEHRESTEWQMLNPRRKRNLVGCTHKDCVCTSANTDHVRKG